MLNQYYQGASAFDDTPDTLCEAYGCHAPATHRHTSTKPWEGYAFCCAHFVQNTGGICRCANPEPDEEPKPITPPIEIPGNPPPPLYPLYLPDTTELAAEMSAQEGLDLADAHAIATEHLRRVTSGAGPVCTNCGQYGHTAIDCPEPPLPRPGRVNWSDRERCSFCCGNHPTADCPLRSRWHAITLLVQPTRCGNCAGDHSVQRCPELWQALRAPAPDTGLALIIETLHLARRELADLRASGLHSAAASVCADTLNHIEAWLDPEAAAVRQEQLAAQRELVRATLAERVVLDGVAVPF